MSVIRFHHLSLPPWHEIYTLQMRHDCLCVRTSLHHLFAFSICPETPFGDVTEIVVLYSAGI
jgi:hypothetical protein